MSGPRPGERPNDDVATAAARGTADTPAPTDLSADRGGVWPGRRWPTRLERWLVSALAVLLAGYLVFLLATADWTAHPVLASLTAVCGAASVGWGLAGIRTRRPRPVEGVRPPLSDLPRPTRRALRRVLRAGHPGPPELHPYAVTWTCQGLQPPWTQAPLLATPALIAGGMAGEPTAPRPFGLVMLGLALALAVYSTTDQALRRHSALRVADALDRLTPPRPPLRLDPA